MMNKKILLSLLLLIVIAGIYYVNTFNDYQQDGELTLAILNKPVTVVRDDLGIPYIYAESMADALRAQGFIIAQNRLYQAELYKHIAQGRLAELIGQRGEKTDVLIRTVGIQQLAAKQLEQLNDDAKRFYQHYIDGINAYINQQQHEHPFSLTLLDLSPKPWTLQDIIALQYFQIWSSTANWRTELLAQQLIGSLGAELANEISQVSINPEDEVVVAANLLDDLPAGLQPVELQPVELQPVKLRIDAALLQAFPNPLNAASNAWASDAKKSANGAAIFSNSPHIDASTLPGFWQPMGLFTPELRAIGAAAPGTPGFGIARTEDIVFGATNDNSDGVDLYIETLDPNIVDHYLEGEKSIAMTIRNEVMLIKDDNAEGGFQQKSLRIRSSRRGPLLSDHGISLADNKAIALRWAAINSIADSLGTEELLLAKNIDQARAALRKNPTPLSHIVVDKHGDIARISTGRVPKRLRGDGSKPYVVTDSSDNWDGVIPFDEMPMNIRPASGWAGTANHRVVKADYPYAYSTFFSSSWRYRRIKEFMTAHKTVSVDNHWSLINDVKNPMAQKLAPLFISVLNANEDTINLAKILSDWNLRDDINQSGAAVFQLMVKHFARLTFSDNIDTALWPEFFDATYYWQERLLLLMQDNHNHWFDDITTGPIETRDDLLRFAAKASIDELTQRLGADPANWQWGNVLTITFSSPVIPGKSAAEWLGAGTRPMFGSSQTLNRGKYPYSSDYKAKYIDSIRFVADMSDNEKVVAVVPGGSSGRYLDPSLHNQTDAWMNGSQHSWWFSDEKIKAHAVHTLKLNP